MISPLFLIANGYHLWPNNTWTLNSHLQFSLSARLHWRTRPTPGSWQCTILDHSRHLMEIGEPSRMVRRQPWSPSSVCQCGRWVARTSRWRSFNTTVSIKSYLRLPCYIFTVSGLGRFREEFFPCKGRTARVHIKNRRLFRNKFCSSLPQSEIGYSAKFLPEFLVLGPLLDSPCYQQEKDSKRF